VVPWRCERCEIGLVCVFVLGWCVRIKDERRVLRSGGHRRTHPTLASQRKPQHWQAKEERIQKCREKTSPVRRTSSAFRLALSIFALSLSTATGLYLRSCEGPPPIARRAKSAVPILIATHVSFPRAARRSRGPPSCTATHTRHKHQRAQRGPARSARLQGVSSHATRHGGSLGV
jgi:hypothetical protein